MINLEGKYGFAKIYAKTIEDNLIKQCLDLLNEPMTKNAKIAIMPDAHAGKGCMVGTTMQIKKEICPNLVGVDIGCGMLSVNLGKEELDLKKIDKIIDDYIPLGFDKHEEISKETEEFFNNPLNKVKAKFKKNVVYLSLGTLGGGNHFIEIDVDEKTKEKYLIIHTGSRIFGLQIANYWQNIAIEELIKPFLVDIQELINKLKDQGKQRQIPDYIKKAKEQNEMTIKHFSKHKKELATISGENLKNYLNDVEIATRYAKKNREVIASKILKNYFNKNLEEFEFFHTIHNYIDTENMILRKGAISAKHGEKVLIPLNMRDGSLIATGKGNADWNYSAPHGAGRLMSRSFAKESITIEDFKKSMEGIFSTSVNESTIDESPLAYKDSDEIISLVRDTVDIVKHIKPIYNRKGC